MIQLTSPFERVAPHSFRCFVRQWTEHSVDGKPAKSAIYAPPANRLPHKLPHRIG